MLFESDVIDAVCCYLAAHDFEIHQRLSTKQRGIDLVACRRVPPAMNLYVEAKGETSERKGSERFGKPFDSAQVKIHVAEALYTVAQLTASQTGPNDRVAMALPKTALHERYVALIQPTLTSLGVGVFWIAADRKVSVVAPWQV